MTDGGTKKQRVAVEILLALGASPKSISSEAKEYLAEMLGSVAQVAPKLAPLAKAARTVTSADSRPEPVAKKTYKKNTRASFNLKSEVTAMFSDPHAKYTCGDVTSLLNKKGVFFTGRNLREIAARTVYPTLQRLVKQGVVGREEVGNKIYFVSTAVESKETKAA